MLFRSQQITNCVVLMEDGRNTPIIMFTRKPGMIVGYDFDGTWTHRMPRSAEHEYIIGLFVANSENRMKDIIDSKAKTEISLEEYIRQGEKADHASWTDRNIAGTNPRVITKIQNGVINKISKQFKEKDSDVTEKKNVGLGHALANILLPSSDFGRRSITPTPPGPGPTPPVRAKKSKLTIKAQPSFANGVISVDFEIVLKKSCTLNLQVITDFKKFSANEWEDDEKVGKKFPLSFEYFSISTIQRANARKAVPVEGVRLTNSIQSSEFEAGKLSVVASARFGSLSAVKFDVEAPCTITGVMAFSTDDTQLKGVFELKEDKQ